jgi:hypothetical protein
MYIQTGSWNQKVECECRASFASNPAQITNELPLMSHFPLPKFHRLPNRDICCQDRIYGTLTRKHPTAQSNLERFQLLWWKSLWWLSLGWKLKNWDDIVTAARQIRFLTWLDVWTGNRMVMNKGGDAPRTAVTERTFSDLEHSLAAKSWNRIFSVDTFGVGPWAPIRNTDSRTNASKWVQRTLHPYL